jgi:glucose-6-phosphate isomerase
VAVSSNVEKASAFGIHPDNIFPLWDWVGGRYSLWSAIGLPVALGIGMRSFRDLLAGAHAMDEHFRSAEPNENIPLIMGLLAVWYLNVWGAESQVVLPYLQNLHLFPAFLQQLDMESLGKSVKKDGTPVSGASGGIIWGSAGTNGQHSFHQLLHQGTHLIPADFIAAARSHYDADRHAHLLANCFAQSQALMDGKSLEAATQELLDKGMSVADAQELAAHKAVPGNRPSNTILMEALTPFTLGSLIAAYEHKVYVQSVVMGINAFDQWGVELGKILGTGVHNALTAEQDATGFDASTNALINFCRHKKS